MTGAQRAQHYLHERREALIKEITGDLGIEPDSHGIDEAISRVEDEGQCEDDEGDGERDQGDTGR